jgi:DNA-binding MarR family transcriptional regulator
MSSLKNLLSFKLRKSADLLGRSAALRYKRLFGVSLLEWRTLALIGEYSPMSVSELAEHASLDKSQVSRVIAALSQRKLVVRKRNVEDGRGITLELTAEGRRVCEKLLSEADDRNSVFLDCLSAAEKKSLDAALEKLTVAGKRLMALEQQINASVAKGHRRSRSK